MIQKPSAPFYSGASAGRALLGELVLTGLETPAFIPGTVVAKESMPVVEVRSTPWLKILGGVAVLGGAYWFMKGKK